MVKPNCDYCGCVVPQRQGHINRARKKGLPLYCDRKCAGLGRRKHKTVEQKKKEKKAYDILYRKNNLKRLATEKAKYFQRTYDPAKAAVERKKRMPSHLEYCRKPEYRAKKQKYDEIYRTFGTVRVPQEFKEIVDLQKQLAKAVSTRDGRR